MSEFLNRLQVEKESGGSLTDAGATDAYDFLKQSTDLDRSVNLAREMDPEVEAKRQRLAEESGLPYSLVREKQKEVENKLKSPDTDELMRTSPGTAKYMSQLASSAVSWDDHKQLTLVERAWKGIKNTPARLAAGEGLIPNEALGPLPEFIQGSPTLPSRMKQAWQASRDNIHIGNLYHQKAKNILLGKVDPTLENQIAMAEARRVTTPEDPTFLDTMATGAAEQGRLMLHQIAAGQTTGIAYGVTGAMGAAAVGQMGPQALTPEEVITAPVAGGIMYAAGVKVGSADAMFVMESGLALEEMLSLTDENGSPIDPKVAAMASMAVGGINAGLEFVGLKYLPGGEKLLGGWARTSVAKALKQPTVRKALLRLVGKYALGVATETLTEVAQEAVTIVGAEIAKDLTEDSAFKELEWSDVQPRLFEAGKEAFAATLVLGAGGTVIDAGTEAQRIRQANMFAGTELFAGMREADRFHDAVNNMNDAVNGTKTKERNPEASKEHLDMVGAGEDVFIAPEFFQSDSEKAKLVFQQVGIDPGVAQQRAEMGQDIAVPLSELMARLPDEDFKALSKDIKPAPSAMTKREVEAVDVKAEVRKISERTRAAQEERKAVNKEVTRIRKDVLAAGFTREYADLLSGEILARMASGKEDPAAYLKGIRIAGNLELPEAGTQREEFRDWFAGSKVVDPGLNPLQVYPTEVAPGVTGYQPRIENRQLRAYAEQRLEDRSYLAIRKPKEITEEEYAGVKEGGLEELKQTLAGEGYDGIVTPDGTYIPFDAAQVGASNMTREEFADQLSKLPDIAMAEGFKEDTGTGRMVFNVTEANRAATKNQEKFQGIEEPVFSHGQWRFMRGAAGKKKTGVKLAHHVLAENFDETKLEKDDDATSMAEAIEKAERTTYLTPVVQENRKALRYNDKITGFYGNEKMMFPTYSAPRGRRSWDIFGCGRMAWAVNNDISMCEECYYGECYAGRQGARYGRENVASGDITVPVKSEQLRGEVQTYYDKNGMEKTQKRYPALDIKVNTHKGSKRYGQLTLTTQKGRMPAAEVTTRLQKADGVDIRQGVDTDGAAWLAMPEVLDAMLAANPNQIDFYVSAYHTPPPPHPLSARSMINVTVSGWHGIVETMHRLKWAEEARANGWNVILREVVADPKVFPELAERYNRIHEALMQTDFTIMQQPLHKSDKQGDPLWGMPACCNGSLKNPGTCDQCETAEGKGREYKKYWNIREEPGRREETLLPDTPPKELKERYAAPWPESFPNVTVHTTNSTLTKKNKELHTKAKAGDRDSAIELVANVIKPDRIKALAEQYPGALVVPVIAEEATGHNKLPAAYAQAIEDIGGLKVHDDIVQVNVSAHSQKSAVQRLFAPADFVGHVIPEKTYILVDDVVTSGATLNDLRLYIESRNGKVVHVTTLGFARGSTVLAAKPETIAELEQKHDRQELEQLLAEYGAPGSLDSLTQSQADFLKRFKTLDTLRDRIAEAGIQRRSEVHERQIQAPGLALFQEDGEFKPRGSVKPTDTGYVISLFKGRADLSTIIHELGHVHLMDMGQAVADGTANEQTIADLNAIRKWMGMEEGQAFETKHHEQFAKAFERYLWEGKAPTAALRKPFQRFKQWLRSVYRTAAEILGPGVELSDEVREVFDRMLADETSIEWAALNAGMTMPPDTQLTAMGVVAEDKNYLKRLLGQAKASAEEAMVRERDKDRIKSRKMRRIQAEKDVENDPVRLQAQTIIAAGGINRQMLKEEFGEQITKRLPARFTTTQGGMAPDFAASLPRADGVRDEPLFTSTYDMVVSIAQLLPVAEAVKIRIAQLEQEHDAQYRAEDYIFDTREYGEFLRIMAKYEKRDTRGVTPTKAFKVYAQEQLDSMTVREAVQHGRFLAAMKKQARLEADFAAAQDFGPAAAANELVRLNYEMTGQAIKNRKFVEDVEKKIKGAARAQTIDPKYVLNIRALALRFNLGTPTTQDVDMLKKVPLDTLLTDDEDIIDNSGAFSIFLTDESFTMDYRDLSMSQMRELGDLLAFLITRGRDAKKQMLADGRMSIEEAVQLSVAESMGIKGKSVYQRWGIGAWLADRWRSYIAMADSLPFLCIALGGYQNIGWKGVKSITENLISDRLRTAQNEEVKLRADINKRLDPHLTAILKGIERLKKTYGRKIVLDGNAHPQQGIAQVPYQLRQMGQSNTKNGKAASDMGWWEADQIFAVVHNLGNEGNLSRLKQGYPDLTDDAVEALLDLLTEEELNAIQGVWDTYESLYPEINAVHKRINGYDLDKVKPRDVYTRYGKLKGGYAPIVFDGRLMGSKSQRIAGWTEKDDLMASSEAIRQVPKSKSGFTKTRQDNVKLPLKLSMSIVSAHFRDTSHYITHVEAVRDINRIINHESFVTNAQQFLGMPVYDMMKAGLKHVARPERTENNFMTWLMGKVRPLTTAAILGMNFSVALKQWFSSPGAMFEIGGKAWLKGHLHMFGLADYIQGTTIIMERNPIAKYRQILDLSPFMRERAEAVDTDLINKLDRMRPEVGPRQVRMGQLRDFMFILIRMVDAMTVMPIWHGALKKGLDVYQQDLSKAIRYADDVVAKTQPVATPLDLNEWQRSPAARIFAMFATFTVGKYFQRKKLHWNAMVKGKMSKQDWALHQFLETIIPAMLMKMLIDLIKNEPMPWDEPEEDDMMPPWMDYMTTTLGYGLVTGMPLFQELISPFSAPLETPWTEAGRIFKRAVVGPVETVADYLRGEEEDAAAAAQAIGWDLFELMSFTSGVPASRLWENAIKGAGQMEEGEGHPLNLLIPGPRK